MKKNTITYFPKPATNYTKSVVPGNDFFHEIKNTIIDQSNLLSTRVYPFENGTEIANPTFYGIESELELNLYTNTIKFLGVVKDPTTLENVFVFIDISRGVYGINIITGTVVVYYDLTTSTNLTEIEDFFGELSALIYNNKVYYAYSPSPGSAVFTDGTTPAAINDMFQIVLFHNNRFWGINKSNGSIHFSAAMDPASWPAENNFVVPNNVISAISFNGIMFIFTEYGMWALRGTDIFNFRLDKISSLVLQSFKSIVVSGTFGVVFISDELGMYVIENLIPKAIYQNLLLLFSDNFSGIIEGDSFNTTDESFSNFPFVTGPVSAPKVDTSISDVPFRYTQTIIEWQNDDTSPGWRQASGGSGNFDDYLQIDLNDVFGDIQNFAGTVTLTNSSDEIVGAGTSFTSQYSQDDVIWVELFSVWYDFTITDVTDNTHITVSTPWAGSTFSDLPHKAVNKREKVRLSFEVNIDKGGGVFTYYVENLGSLKMFLYVNGIQEHDIGGVLDTSKTEELNEGTNVLDFYVETLIPDSSGLRVRIGNFSVTNRTTKKIITLSENTGNILLGVNRDYVLINDKSGYKIEPPESGELFYHKNVLYQLKNNYLISFKQGSDLSIINTHTLGYPEFDTGSIELPVNQTHAIYEIRFYYIIHTFYGVEPDLSITYLLTHSNPNDDSDNNFITQITDSVTLLNKSDSSVRIYKRRFGSSTGTPVVPYNLRRVRIKTSGDDILHSVLGMEIDVISKPKIISAV